MSFFEGARDDHCVAGFLMFPLLVGALAAGHLSVKVLSQKLGDLSVEVGHSLGRLTRDVCAEND